MCRYALDINLCLSLSAYGDFTVEMGGSSRDNISAVIDTLMAKLRRSRDAIVRALKALRSHGFVDWLRRYIPTGNPGAGPQVQQTSNAYRLSLPARAKALLGKYGAKPPILDDIAQERQEREEAINAHLKALSLPERALEVIEDSKLGQALARLGKNIENKRESAKQTESLPRSC